MPQPSQGLCAAKRRPTLPKKLSDFKYMSFDVVGTLIDFEGGLKSTLIQIGAENGVEVDGEKALSLYRAARYSDATDLFPDDLVRVYLIIAPELGFAGGRALEVTPARRGKTGRL